MAHDPHASSSQSQGSIAEHAYDPATGDDVPAHGGHLPEPRSPAWLPLLGIGLLALVLVWWLSTPNDDQERAAAAAAASASASASVQAPPEAAANAPNPNAPNPLAPPQKPALPPGFVPTPAIVNH